MVVVAAYDNEGQVRHARASATQVEDLRREGILLHVWPCEAYRANRGELPEDIPPAPWDD